jgi:hypothetical protein
MAQRLIVNTLCLSLAIYALTPQFVQTQSAYAMTNIQADESALYCRAEITQFVPQNGGKTYSLAVSVMGPEWVRYVVVQVWDEKRGQIADPQSGQVDRVFDLNDQTQPIELNAANWEAEHTYDIKVRATNETGYPCSKNQEGETVLASIQIEQSSPHLEFLVNSVTPDFEQRTLQIDLSLPDTGREYVYSGFINNKGGQLVAKITRGLLVGAHIVLPLPEPMRKATVEQSYQLMLVLETQDAAPQRIDYEFTPPLPPRVCILKCIGPALMRYPAILAAIIALLGSASFWYAYETLRSKPPANDPLRPPIDPQTRLNSDQALAQPPKTNGVNTASNRNGVQLAKPGLWLRVIHTPEPPLETEVLISDFPFTIGRQGCNFNLADQRVSAWHLTINAQGASSKLYLTDHESRNGTFIADQRLNAYQTVVLDGALQVRLGQQTILELTPQG